MKRLQAFQASRTIDNIDVEKNPNITKLLMKEALNNFVDDLFESELAIGDVTTIKIHRKNDDGATTFVAMSFSDDNELWKM